MIEELRTLAERSDEIAAMEFSTTAQAWENLEQQSQFFHEFRKAIPAILSVASKLEVAKEAISDACDIMQTAKGLAEGPEGGSVTDHLDLAEHRLDQALAALEVK